MSQLLQIISGALDNIDIEGVVGGQAANLTSVGTTVSQLSQGQIPELSTFINSISEMDLPDFDLTGELTESFSEIRELVPGDMLDVLGPITEALEQVDSSIGDGITNLLEPLVNCFRAVQTLLHTNFNFDNQATAGSTINGGGDGSDGGETGIGGIVSGDPETRIDPTGLQTFQALLDELPESPTVANLLQWLDDRVTIGRGDMVEQALGSLPFLDDVRAPLHSVLSWQSMNGSDLTTRFSTTLQTLTQAISKQVAGGVSDPLHDLGDHLLQLDLIQLRQTVVAIGEQLDLLSSHIDSDSLTEQVLTEVENSMSTLTAERDSLLEQFATLVRPGLSDKLAPVEQLSLELQEKMTALLLVLQPPNAPQEGNNSILPPSLPASGGFDGLETFLDQYTTIFENLISFLDIGDIGETFAEPAESLRQAADQIDQAITMVTLEISNRLNRLQELVSGLDVSSLSEQANQAIEDFTSTIVNNLTEAFAGVRQVIESIASGISTLITSFNPDTVVETLEDGMDALGAVLQNPQITAVLEVAEKIKSIAARLENLSFSPVTDTVVGTIEDMKSAVQGLGSSLDDPLKGMLSSAIGVLPDDLTPVTDPLIEGLGDVIEAGPIPLLEAIKDGPQQVVDALNSFDPASLIGDSLSAPFQDIISEIKDFEPDSLLEPVSAEIENFKNRIRENCRPGDLLDPLIEIHDQVLLDLDGFRPATLIEPLGSQLTDAVQNMSSAIPVASVFEEIESVIGDMERLLGANGVADSILQLLGRLRDFLGPFVTETLPVETLLQSWLEDILNTVVDQVDMGSLEPAFTALTGAIDNTRSETLQSLNESAAEPILSAVRDILQPGSLMTALVQSHSGLRSAKDRVSDQNMRDRINTLLQQVQPTDPETAEIFTTLNRVVTALEISSQGLVDTLSHWDETFHSPTGVLASYHQIPATTGELKQWLLEALALQLIRPLQSFFEKLGPTGRILDSFLEPIADLLESLRDTVNQITAAPAALLAVGESIEQVMARLENVNLDFIAESIDAIYEQAVAQFRALDPRSLKDTVNKSFEELLAVISLETIIPVDALNQTDDDIDQALEALRRLDPQILIAEVIQPKFDEILAPVISALDLSPALNTLTERLRPLEDELHTEMDRVNQAYQSFLNSVPA